MFFLCVCVAEDPANRTREEKKRFRSRQTASKQGINHSDSYSRRIDLPRSNAVAREARTFAYVPLGSRSLETTSISMCGINVVLVHRCQWIPIHLKFQVWFQNLRHARSLQLHASTSSRSMQGRARLCIHISLHSRFIQLATQTSDRHRPRKIKQDRVARAGAGEASYYSTDRRLLTRGQDRSCWCKTVITVSVRIRCSTSIFK